MTRKLDQITIINCETTYLLRTFPSLFQYQFYYHLIDRSPHFAFLKKHLISTLNKTPFVVIVLYRYFWCSLYIFTVTWQLQTCLKLIGAQEQCQLVVFQLTCQDKSVYSSLFLICSTVAGKNFSKLIRKTTDQQTLNISKQDYSLWKNTCSKSQQWRN